MNILNRFLCDWGSPDSNMLLLFLLTSFLLGLLAGWLIWGRKIQDMLNQVAQREGIINDINAKLILREAESSRVTKSNEELMAKNRLVAEEKGQLYADLMACRNEAEQLKNSAAAMPAPIIAAASAPSIAAEVSAVVEPIEEITAVAETTDTAATEALEDLPVDDANTGTDIETEEVVEVGHNEIASTDDTANAVNEVEFIVRSGTTKDDLKIIEGIGPKIESLLNDAGVYTFNQLANSDLAQIQAILAAAGRRYQMHDPSTWSRQAQMASEGNWDELRTWQDTLKGGKE
jgi:predicted flap endonuclease-1-like 5' DNA nuclease